MKIQSLVKNLQQALPPSEKTASAPSKPEEKTASDAPIPTSLQKAMREVVANAGSTKEASAPSVADVLTKEAEQLLEAEKTAGLRDAQMRGVAFAEAALLTFDKAGQAADQLLKEAAAGLDPETIELVKQAQQDPEGFLRRVQAGYEAQRATQNPKLAHDAELQNYVRNVHATATDHYLAGYQGLRDALVS